MGEETEEVAELAVSGLVDADWYLSAYPDVAAAELDPVLHFCRHGWAEWRNPNAYFDCYWYCGQNPDVVAAGVNPLRHYIRLGESAGYRPMPHFDPAWYRSAHQLAGGEGALRHFLVHRRGGLFAPDWTLWAVPCLPLYCETAADGQDPYGAYLGDMLRMGCEPFPDPGIVEASGLLDPNYYLINGSDVHEAKLDPAQHFCRYGWRERRKPNIYFDTDWYMRTNPDVARLQINPLVHYIVCGEKANRRPVPYFDPEWYRATHSVSADQSALAHYLAHRREQTVSPTPLFDVAWYVERYGEQIGPNRDPFAHYLRAGTVTDLSPSPDFDAGIYRKRHIGRPSRRFPGLMQPDTHNPLVHFLRSGYR